MAPGLVLFVRAFIFETGCTFGPITWNVSYEVRSNAGTIRWISLSPSHELHLPYMLPHLLVVLL